MKWAGAVMRLLPFGDGGRDPRAFFYGVALVI